VSTWMGVSKERQVMLLEAGDAMVILLDISVFDVVGKGMWKGGSDTSFSLLIVLEHTTIRSRVC